MVSLLLCSLQSRAKPANRQGFCLDSKLSCKAATFGSTVILHQDLPTCMKTASGLVLCSQPSLSEYLYHAVPSSYGGPPPQASSGGHLTEQLGQFALHLGWKHFIVELFLHYTQEDCVQQEAQGTQNKLAQTGTATGCVNVQRIVQEDHKSLDR